MEEQIESKDKEIDNLSSLHRIIIEHKLDGSEAVCDKCGNNLVVIGKKSKEILKYKPAELYIG